MLAVSLLSLAALTKLPWGKRLFVFFSAATAVAIAILAYDVLLRTVALEWSFGARRVLDAVVCSAGPLVLAPLFAHHLLGRRAGGRPRALAAPGRGARGVVVRSERAVYVRVRGGVPVEQLRMRCTRWRWACWRF